MSTTENQDVLTLERRGHVLLMGLNRPQKRNAFNIELLMELGRAYELLERDDDLRCGVLFGHGDHFTGGLDLAEAGPVLAEGNLSYPEDARDPWRNDGKSWTTPVIAAVPTAVGSGRVCEQRRILTLAAERRPSAKPSSADRGRAVPPSLRPASIPTRY